MLKQYFEKIYKGSKKAFEDDIKEKILKNEKGFIVTANPETFMIATENKEFNDLLLEPSTMIVPDGIGVVKGAAILGYDVKERITGVDLVTDLLEFSNENERTIYFFGAKEEVLTALKEKLKVTYPKLRILGATNGYVKDKDAVMEEVLKLQPDIILVAIGIPHQELLVGKHYEKFSKGIFIGVGGALDVLSGTKKRAPEIFIKLNLEWLYRIGKEPKRFNRFYKSNIKYIMKIRKIKKGEKKYEN